MATSSSRGKRDRDLVVSPEEAASRPPLAPEGAGSVAPLQWKEQMYQLQHKLEIESQRLDERERQLTHTKMSALRAQERIQWMCQNNQFVVLNVGGTEFNIPVSTLLAEPGSLFEVMLSQHFVVEVDHANGAVVIDRDPESFRFILNYLRGYKRISLTEDEKALVEADIDFYQIPRMRLALGLEQVNYSQRFLPGPGVNVEGTRLRVAYAVGQVGEQLLVAGRHVVSFEVQSGEYLGLGVVSDSCSVTDTEFHKTLNCCVYYMTGVFYSNFTAQKKEEGLSKFSDPDIVTMILDLDEKTLEYIVNGYTTKLVSCATASRLKFAAVGKLSSGVRIVPNDPCYQEPGTCGKQLPAGDYIPSTNKLILDGARQQREALLAQDQTTSEDPPAPPTRDTTWQGPPHTPQLPPQTRDEVTRRTLSVDNARIETVLGVGLLDDSGQVGIVRRQRSEQVAQTPPVVDGEEGLPESEGDGPDAS